MHTRVYSNTKFELVMRSMSYFERSNGIEQRYGHPCNLTTVLCPITYRQSWHHHIGIANRLHLNLHIICHSEDITFVAVIINNILCCKCNKNKSGITSYRHIQTGAKIRPLDITSQKSVKNFTTGESCIIVRWSLICNWIMLTLCKK